MSFTIMEGVKTLINGDSLDTIQTQTIMEQIMSGQTKEVELASFLTALRMHGDDPQVIAGAATVMRKYASKITPKVKKGVMVDTCGTGGDNANTFNISTLSALVAAGAGATIAKHGNRSVSSKCGSADILEAFGVKVDLEPKQVEAMISEIGIGFMFAPKFHPAMKYAMPVRRQLGMRTIFNILGPLTNPAGAEAHILGVFDKELVKIVSKTMSLLGAQHVYVYNSDPGIDEIVPLKRVHIQEIKGDNIRAFELTPRDFNLKPFLLEELQSTSIEENTKIAQKILLGKDKGIKTRIVEINAAYAINSSGIAKDLDHAIELAQDSIKNQQALEKLQNMVEISNGNIDKFNLYFGA